MTGPEMEQYARIGAIVAGIVFGSWALSSVIWVWTKKQIYAYGGSALSVVGVILMGLSIYKTVDVKAAPDGIGIKLAEIEKAVKNQGDAQQAAQQKLAQLPSDLGQKITALDQTVKQQGQIQAAQLKKLEGTASVIQRASTTGEKLTDGLVFFPASGSGLLYGKRAGATKLPDGSNFITFDYTIPPAEKSSDILERIKKTAEEKDSKSPEISGLYMSLGDAYKKEDRIPQAIDAYSAGIQALKDQAKTPKAPEPEKK
jgi:hypothetical protein